MRSFLGSALFKCLNDGHLGKESDNEKEYSYTQSPRKLTMIDYSYTENPRKQNTRRVHDCHDCSARKDTRLRVKKENLPSFCLNLLMMSVCLLEILSLYLSHKPCPATVTVTLSLRQLSDSLSCEKKNVMYSQSVFSNRYFLERKRKSWGNALFALNSRPLPWIANHCHWGDIQQMMEHW